MFSFFDRILRLLECTLRSPDLQTFVYKEILNLYNGVLTSMELEQRQ